MSKTEKMSIKIEFRALGTDIFLEIILGNETKENDAKNDLWKAKEIFFAKEKIFSRFDLESEICQLNKNIGKENNASADMAYVAERALYYNRNSGGLYDPRVIGILEQIGYKEDFRRTDFSKTKIPNSFEKFNNELSADLHIANGKIFLGCRMDFSGIAKGYIVDQAANFLKYRGWKNFLVDAGGDMNIRGRNGKGKKWKIAVEGIPEKKLVLEISDRGIATSGISRKKWAVAGKKYHHLINPKNPEEFSYELRTVSVVEKNAEEADGRAKTLVLMGKEKGLKFAADNKIAAVFLDYRGNVSLSPEAKRYLPITSR